MTPDAELMGKARAALATVFGFSAFRPGQEDVLSATLGGKDVLAVMPTGNRSVSTIVPEVAEEELFETVSV